MRGSWAVCCSQGEDKAVGGKEAKLGHPAPTLICELPGRIQVEGKGALTSESGLEREQPPPQLWRDVPRDVARVFLGH